MHFSYNANLQFLLYYFFKPVVASYFPKKENNLSYGKCPKPSRTSQEIQKEVGLEKVNFILEKK